MVYHICTQHFCLSAEPILGSVLGSEVSSIVTRKDGSLSLIGLIVLERKSAESPKNGDGDL